MLKFLRTIFAKSVPPVQVEIIRRDVCRLTVDEWRGNKELCAAARRVLADPLVRQMVDVCRNTHLAHYVTTGGGVEAIALHASKAEGYGVCLNNLESLGTDIQPDEPLVETWEKPEMQG